MEQKQTRIKITKFEISDCLDIKFNKTLKFAGGGALFSLNEKYFEFFEKPKNNCSFKPYNDKCLINKKLKNINLKNRLLENYKANLNKYINNKQVSVKKENQFINKKNSLINRVKNLHNKTDRLLTSEVCYV